MAVSSPSATASPLPDLLSKIVVPVTLGLCTAYITASANAWNHRKKCADRTLDFYEKLCPGGDCTAGDDPAVQKSRRYVQQSARYSSDFLLNALCSKSDGIDYRAVLQKLIESSSTDAGLAAARSGAGAGSPPSTVETKIAPNDRPVADRPADVAHPPPAPAPGRINIYVQYHLEAQKADVLRVIGALNTATTQAVTINALGPQLVPAKVNRTQIRCFDDASCKAAPDIAKYVGVLVRQPVVVRDFSRAYVSASGKSLPLELWFADAPIKAAVEGGRDLG